MNEASPIAAMNEASGPCLVLWIPRPPDNANNRGHWAKAMAAKRMHQHELGKRVTARLMPAPPAVPFARARIEHHWYYQPPESKRLDPDNAQRRLKHVVDWLVTYGYLAGGHRCARLVDRDRANQRPPAGGGTTPGVRVPHPHPTRPMTEPSGVPRPIDPATLDILATAAGVSADQLRDGLQAIVQLGEVVPQLAALVAQGEQYKDLLTPDSLRREINVAVLDALRSGRVQLAIGSLA